MSKGQLQYSRAPANIAKTRKKKKKKKKKNKNKNKNKNKTTTTPADHIVDRLLKYVGFRSGRESTTCFLSYAEMIYAALDSKNLTTSEVREVWQKYQVDVQTWCDSYDTNLMRGDLSVIMNADIHTHVHLVLYELVGDGMGSARWGLSDVDWVYV
jgi:hypothetical protein